MLFIRWGLTKGCIQLLTKKYPFPRYRGRGCIRSPERCMQCRYIVESWLSVLVIPHHGNCPFACMDGEGGADIADFHAEVQYVAAVH